MVTGKVKPERFQTKLGRIFSKKRSITCHLKAFDWSRVASDTVVLIYLLHKRAHVHARTRAHTWIAQTRTETRARTPALTSERVYTRMDWNTHDHRDTYTRARTLMRARAHVLTCAYHWCNLNYFLTRGTKLIWQKKTKKKTEESVKMTFQCEIGTAKTGKKNK